MRVTVGSGHSRLNLVARFRLMSDTTAAATRVTAIQIEDEVRGFARPCIQAQARAYYIRGLGRRDWLGIVLMSIARE